MDKNKKYTFVKIDPETNTVRIGGEDISPKGILLGIIQGLLNSDLRPELKQELQVTYNYLKEHLKDLKIEPGPGGKLKTTLTGEPDTPEVRKKIRSLLRTPTTGNIIQILNQIQAPGGVEKLHKQPRGFLKTTAKYVGKATDETTLFTLPEVRPEPGAGGNVLREVISRNTAILGHYLFQLWQETGGEDLVIKNLSPIAEMMGNSNYEIKIYLLYLGGYVYPVIDKDKSGGLNITIEQLFRVKFRYPKKVAEKYQLDERGDPMGANFIQGGIVKFIKDEPVDSIVITPNPVFKKALEGKGLGNVLVVNDKFIKLSLSLTDIAYKILSYSASNKPNQRIAEDHLINHLGLSKQLRNQGRPRVRETILKGFKELQDKKHIKSYSFDPETKIYKFTYSDKYIKHSELKKLKEVK